MKKNRHIILLVFVAVIILITGINEAFDLVHCNMRRDYKTMEDRNIQNIKDKIADLEKEDLKDVMTTRRLAEQYSLIGKIYLDRKLWEQGIDAYLNAEKYGRSGEDLYYALGLGYANRGYDRGSEADFAKAEEYYRKALEKNPAYDDAIYGLAILLYYHRNGRDEALRLVTELATRNSSHYGARFAMARMNYENGDAGKALLIYQQLQQDLDRLPDSGAVNNYRTQCAENIAIINSEMALK